MIWHGRVGCDLWCTWRGLKASDGFSKILRPRWGPSGDDVDRRPQLGSQGPRREEEATRTGW
ncbi:hypothetical protein TorRG33x02_104220 [Trema orientale]|uniref:Uncharacterized protein n=1 Tax=Trema orientale TaxID=63057 RepID=A0A2P5F7I5_TREOI|nr:hypothetical protein TorRG33x02_104220 [Trema orientale]